MSTENINEIKEITNLGETTSNRLESNVFKKSTMMQRTPPQENKAPQGETSREEDPKSPPCEDNPSSPETGSVRRKLKALEERIKEFHNFVHSKRNLHTELKQLANKAMAGLKDFKKAAEKVNWGEARKVPKKAVKATQTEKAVEDPAQKGLETPLRPKHTANATNTEKRKREVEAGQKDRTPKQRKRGEGPEEDTPKTSRKEGKPQKEKGKVLARRPRADAIVVETTGSTSYADILRKVKSDPALKEMGEKVIRVTRNQRGQMMFQLKREENPKREDIQAAVSKALGDAAKVTMRTQEVNIECKDMDEVTTKEEILEALEKELGIEGIPVSAIRSMRRTFVETQTAIISLPLEQAKKALTAGKVKIGWTICRLREAIRPKMCFRCLGFGHMAKDCKNEDRSKMCRRCGNIGHIARDCEKDPQCMLCKDGDKPAPHITGSSRCPKFRSAAKTTRT